MFNQIREKILQINSVVGVEISIHSQDEISIHAIHLKLEKNKITKIREEQLLKNPEDLKNKFGIAHPIALTLAGRGVLVKKYPHEENIPNPIERILPTANPDEFYSDILQTPEISFISVVRKDLADGIIEKFTSKGFRILSISLGVRDMQYLDGLINFDNNFTVNTNCYQIKYSQDGQITDVINNPVIINDIDKKEYNIGDQYAWSQTIFPFASATRLLTEGTGGLDTISNNKILVARHSYNQFRWYRSASWVFLIGIFSILLVNFLFYSYYFNKNNAMRVEQNLLHERMERSNFLIGQISKKEDFIQSVGWNKPARLSFYADRIASVVPDSLLLTQMKIYPLNTWDIYESSPLSFKNDTILLTGSCSDPATLNQFTGDLKSINLFRNVTVKNYLLNHDTKNAVFNIELIAK
ncbi:MAG TPA: hypothetical protein VGG71_13480 [Chitinophagaceae bacterium]|jgi:hypothetical protein